jgi:hypothetical protein
MMTCPHCGKGNERHSPVGRDGARTPHDGSLSLCIYCGGFGVFEGGGIRAPTADEAAEIADDGHCILLANQWALWHAVRPKKDDTEG